MMTSPRAWLSLLAFLSNFLSFAGVTGGVGRGDGVAGELRLELVKGVRGESGLRPDNFGRLFFLVNICERRLRCDMLAIYQRQLMNILSPSLL